MATPNSLCRWRSEILALWTILRKNEFQESSRQVAVRVGRSYKSQKNEKTGAQRLAVYHFVADDLRICLAAPLNIQNPQNICKEIL